jgi:hypothetical protein
VARSCSKGFSATGIGKCDGIYVRVNGTVSPGPTLNSPLVLKSSPRSGAVVRQLSGARYSSLLDVQALSRRAWLLLQRTRSAFPRSACWGRPILWGNEPTAMFRRAEESCETSVRIKPWPTQPINGAVATDQRGCLAVADERVVFNTQRHTIVLFYNRVSGVRIQSG